MHVVTRFVAVGCVLALIAAPGAYGLPPQEDYAAGPGADQEISGLIAQLSDTAYATRLAATRRLCAIGPRAISALRSATAADDHEASLRAARILTELQRVLFSGVEVRLEAAPASIQWNETVELAIVMENRSRFPAQVPFSIGSDVSGDAWSDARQVSDMIDASDWLIVRDERGREVDLRVDELSDDPAVLRTVKDRLSHDPMSELNPAEKATLRLTQFNRGWARYPLLDAGNYTVSFRYVPDWTDPVLSQELVGAVQSNSLTVRVIRGAPETVSRGGAKADLNVHLDGDRVVANLVNRTDHVMLVNTNYGVSVPFAEIEWILEADGRRETFPASPMRGRSWDDFEANRFVPVNPGASMELAIVPWTDLVRQFRERGGRAEEITVSASYFNLCDRQWQLREQASLEKDDSVPGVLRQQLPRHILSTRIMSPSTRLP